MFLGTIRPGNDLGLMQFEDFLGVTKPDKVY
jgi:hypothetical protein